MEISNNLYNENLGIRNRKTSFYNEEKNKTKAEVNGKINQYRSLYELFEDESRQEFFKKLKSKNSLPFFTQILNQNQTPSPAKKQFIAIEAYTKSIKISDLIYGSIEYSHFFA
ncbi:MAG: hypothetical protein CMM18_01015 [Rhodospirillaceae bacterium]|nr:hypothetical protein [Rhodospirillaceae bacterium]